MAGTTATSGEKLARELYPSTVTWWSTGVAMLVSLIVHTCFLLFIALVSLAKPPDSDPLPVAATEVAIASWSSEHLTHRGDERLDEAPFVAHDSHDTRLDAELEILASVSGPVASQFTVDDLASPIASVGGDRDVLLDRIDAPPSAGRGEFDSQATFMGVQAQGERFCIIADGSGSMAGEKFEFLKREILTTVAGMSPHARLQLVLFNQRAIPFPKDDWLHPLREELAIDEWLRTLAADGDTYPTPGFIYAFGLSPPPDTIFFMTDGQFDPRVLYQIRRLQRESQRTIKIHTITFMDRGSEGLMKIIAAESGGVYRHVSGIAAAAE